MDRKVFNGIVDMTLLDKHYFRKHGENAYYGQDSL